MKYSNTNVPRVLVGTKVDLVAKARVVEYEEAKALAVANGMNYHEVSALTRTGIDELCADIFNQSVNFMKTMTETLLTSLSSLTHLKKS